ncbi:MAG: PAS domain-containing protein [Desulfobacterales bacterium]
MIANLPEFVGQLPAAIYRVTMEGKIIYCNNAYARLFGFDTARELIGSPVIRLYRNKTDRGHLLQALLQRGLVIDTPMAFLRKDGMPLWCAVTAKAVLDDDGMVVFLDGMLRDITGEIEERGPGLPGSTGMASEAMATFLLDVQGRFLEANEAGHRLLGSAKGELDGRAITDFFPESDRDLFLLILGDIRKMGREEVVLRLKNQSGVNRFAEITAIFVRTEGRAHHVKVLARDVTEQIRQAEERRNIEKFQGVLEMAGAVAHRFNQPLTVVTNVINELLSEMTPADRFYGSIQKAQDQIKRLNEITTKIGNIKKYAATDYVAGVKIVDIDQAS